MLRLPGIAIVRHSLRTPMPVPYCTQVHNTVLSLPCQRSCVLKWAAGHPTGVRAGGKMINSSELPGKPARYIDRPWDQCRPPLVPAGWLAVRTGQAGENQPEVAA